MSVEKLRPSFTFNEERIEQLKALVPEAFADGKINWGVLKETLGEFLEPEEAIAEHFGFTWPGKRESRRLASLPSQGAIHSLTGEGINEDISRNIFIEGDNLEVLKLLQKTYANRIKLIFIDPPYNTGNDYVYRDDFSDPLDAYLRLTNVLSDTGEVLTTNKRTSGRFHAAWLSMMYPRLLLARNLLLPDGVLIVTIDDNEVGHLRIILDEIFGEENFVANVVWQKKYTRSNDAKWFSNNHDHILIYARNKELFRPNLQPRSDSQLDAYSNPDNHPKGPWKSTPLHAKSGNDTGFSYTFRNGVTWTPPKGTFPRYSIETLRLLDEKDEIWFGNDGTATPSRKSFLEEVKDGVTPVTIWLHSEAGNTHQANNDLKELDLGGVFDNPKPVKLLDLILELTTNTRENHIVMDFFAGSGTTAQAVLEKNVQDGGNRSFILVQLPEEMKTDEFSNIAEITKARIRRTIEKLEREKEDQLPLGNSYEDLGFRVFALRESNFRVWESYNKADLRELQKQLDMFETPLIDDWEEDDLLVEVMLLQGFPLDSRVTRLEEFTKNTVRLVESDFHAHRLFVCLDRTVQQATIDQLDLNAEDIFVCLDSALTDTAKMRLADVCNLRVI